MNRIQASQLRRSCWLVMAVELLRPMFRRAGYPLPAKIDVKCKRTTQKHYLGEHWQQGEMAMIRVAPKTRTIVKGQGVLSILHHELAHAAASRKHGGQYSENGDCHGPLFKKVMVATHHWQEGGDGTARKLWARISKELGSYRGRFGIRHPGDRLRFTCSCGRTKIIWWNGYRYVSGSWVYKNNWTCGRSGHTMSPMFNLV